MASWQARERDPLLDQGMQAALERRGRELIGLVLVGIAVLFTLMLGSYSPSDPGWMVSTQEPASNLLGRFGAGVSSTLMMLLGRGAWAMPLLFLAWGIRLILHRGVERVTGRLVFAVIAIALSAVFFATLSTPEGWQHTFGLGGLFGDTAAGALLGMLPGESGLGLMLLTLVAFGIMLAMLLFVMGFDLQELRHLARWGMAASVIAYARFLQLAGQGVSGAMQGARTMADRGRTFRQPEFAIQAERAIEDAPPPFDMRNPAGTSRKSMVHRQAQPMAERGFEPLMTPPGAPAPLAADMRYHAPEPSREKRGLLARIRGVMEPDQPTETNSGATAGGQVPEDRIKARISAAIRTHVRQSGTGAADAAMAMTPIQAAVARHRAEPPLVRRRRPMPLLADTRPMMPPEPPVTAGQAVDFAEVPDYPVLDEQEEFLPGSEFSDSFDQPVDEAEGRILPYDMPEWQDEDDFDQEEADQDVLAESYEDSANRAMPPTALIAPGQALDRRPIARGPATHRDPVADTPRRRVEKPAIIYELPPLSLLASPEKDTRQQLSDEVLEANARMLEAVLDDYGVRGEIVSVRPGPVVTMYELEPAPGLKASRVIGLADDIARSMSALSARVSTVPGRKVIGIELPNETRETVYLREILSARDFNDTQMKLPLALGKNIGGEPFVTNLAKMPHLLIAGTTGSGKSVAINTMILSLIYKRTPEECRLIMIDPKMLELSVYDGIPHLLSPVVTDPKKAVVALKWVVGEMEERYRRMSKMGVRNIEGYNGRVRETLAAGEMFSRTIQTGFDDETGNPVFETEEFAPEPFPYIVVIVDEMADLMMVAGKEIEACIQRLAQMARASGIHLIMATQRPSVDVITGTIKANFPTRVSFQVTSKIDSRTILGEQGAEQLLGQGDMLYMGTGARVTRLHGPFVSDEEVEEIVNFLKSFGPPEYMSGVVDGLDEDKADDIDLVLGLGGEGDDEDDLYHQSVAIVAKDRRCSTSYIQRKLSIGYNRAARLVERMEEDGVVSPANHVGKREILIPET